MPWTDDPEYVEMIFGNAAGANSRVEFYNAAEKMLHDALLKSNGSPVEDICSICLDEVKEAIILHVREHFTKGNAFNEWIADKIEEVLEEWTVECQPFITTLVHMQININRCHKDFQDQMIVFSSLKPSPNTDANVKVDITWKKPDEQIEEITECNSEDESLFGTDTAEKKKKKKNKLKILKKDKHSSPQAKVKDELHKIPEVATPHIQPNYNSYDYYPEVESCEEVTIKMLNNVFNIARDNIKDAVPKAIKFHFIKRILDRDLETEVLNRWDDLKEREREISDEEMEYSELFGIMNTTKEETEKRLKLKLAENALKEAVDMLEVLRKKKK